MLNDQYGQISTGRITLSPLLCVQNATFIVVYLQTKFWEITGNTSSLQNHYIAVKWAKESCLVSVECLLNTLSSNAHSSKCNFPTYSWFWFTGSQLLLINVLSFCGSRSQIKQLAQVFVPVMVALTAVVLWLHVHC